MKKTIVASVLALSAFTAASEAKAWGLHNGETLNAGGDALYGEFGWPNLALGFQHGITNRFDLGFRFSLLYGWEYRTDYVAVGMGMQVPLRFQVFKTGKISGLIHFDPGIRIDRFDGIQFGLQFPLGFEMGVHLTPEATLQFGFDMPFDVNFTNGDYVAVVPLFGFGFEYAVDRNINVGLNTRFGPSIVSGHDINNQAWSDTRFGLLLQPYFAYHL